MEPTTTMVIKTVGNLASVANAKATGASGIEFSDNGQVAAVYEFASEDMTNASYYEFGAMEVKADVSIDITAGASGITGLSRFAL